MKLNEIYSFINENALLTEGVSKKNILAGLDYLASTNLPKIYEAVEIFSRGEYDIDFHITNSNEIKDNFYKNPDVREYYKEFSGGNWNSFPVLITKLKSGNVVLLSSEETFNWFSLDKTKLVEALHAKRLEDIGFFEGYNLDELKQNDIDKLSQLP